MKQNPAWLIFKVAHIDSCVFIIYFKELKSKVASVHLEYILTVLLNSVQNRMRLFLHCRINTYLSL